MISLLTNIWVTTQLYPTFLKYKPSIMKTIFLNLKAKTMKKLLFIISTIGFITVMSCKKEEIENAPNTSSTVTVDSTKWIMGTNGKMDTIVNLKPKTTGNMAFKISNNSLCQSHIIGLTIKVNGAIMLEANRTYSDTLAYKFPVKTTDAVSVQTKLVQSTTAIKCITLGRADCIVTE
jgi:hypothetical protein